MSVPFLILRYIPFHCCRVRRAWHLTMEREDAGVVLHLTMFILKQMHLAASQIQKTDHLSISVFKHWSFIFLSDPFAQLNICSIFLFICFFSHFRLVTWEHGVGSLLQSIPGWCFVGVFPQTCLQEPFILSKGKANSIALGWIETETQNNTNKINLCRPNLKPKWRNEADCLNKGESEREKRRKQRRSILVDHHSCLSLG